MAHINKITSSITAVLTLSFIAVFSVVTVFGKKEKVSFEENRTLAEIPELSAAELYDGSASNQLSAYFADHFPFRSSLISAKTVIQTELSECIVNGVYVGDDRLIEFEPSQEMPPSANADIFSRYAEKYKGAVCFAAIPSSAGIYGDTLPVHSTAQSESRQISAFYDFLSSDIRKIDAYNILKMLNENYIYYRNDSKWTSYGAYCVYKAVIKKLGFIPTSYDKYSIRHITDDFRGDLYNRVLSAKIKADIIDKYDYPSGASVCSCFKTDAYGRVFASSIYDKDYLKSSDMYSFYLGEPVPFLSLTTTVNSNKKLLVIKDRYADCFIPFLIQHYSEIAVVSPQDMKDSDISDYVDINDYDQTLFLFGVESLGNRTVLEKIIGRD